MNDIYSYILADLLKRNTRLHGRELEKRNISAKWPSVTNDICLKELQRINPTSKMMAFSGLIWHKLRQQNITTRCIYQLLLQWALLLTEKGLLSFYTSDYENLLIELKTTIESGSEGAVEDIPPQEIIDEWNFMKDFLPQLLEMVENYKINVG